MNNQVQIDAFEGMVKALGNFNKTLSDSTAAMKKSVEVCRDAMGSDEYSAAIMDNLEECLKKYKVAGDDTNEAIRYLRSELERIRNIKF